MVADERPADFVQLPVSALVALLPDSTDFWKEQKDRENMWDYCPAEDALKEAAIGALPALRQAAGDCPACIMAALRQAKIPVPMVDGFSFKKEMEEIWSCINEAQASYY
jgi:hypothetical protein